MHLQQDQPPQDASLPPVHSSITIATDPSPAQGPHESADNVNKTEPQPKYLYFAYGSNLSPTQMRDRCTHDPNLSGHPVAIAALDHWRWLICQFGYANVVPPAGLRVGPEVLEGDEVPESVSNSIPEGGVYGVLYEMSEADERVLDGYEGVDHESQPSKWGWGDKFRRAPDGEGVPGELRPREQGAGLYNKWYVDARVVGWLDEDYRRRKGFEGVGGNVRVLVYIDELRVRVDAPKEEYIPRMNRAIREAVKLGFPEDWAEAVMRPAIPKE
ncbi:hypothetical protein BDV18DRAFT_164420 [Aspergillus unguis]